MAILNSFGNLATVGSSKALRATYYDTRGNGILQETTLTSWVAPIDFVRPAANAFFTGWCFYTLKNGADGVNQQTRIRIKRISGAMHFNGTAAVGTPFIKLSWVRYWSANVGTQAVSEAVTVVRKRSSYATRAVTSATTLNVAVQPQLECAQALSTDSGLPMGSILRSNRETYDLCMPLAVTGRSQPFDIQPDALDLEPSEGLALYCLTNSGSNEGGGFGMTGMIEIDEQALR